MKVYLDNCCYNRPYDDQEMLMINLETQAKLEIQELIKNKKIQLAASFILWYELGQNPYEMRKKGITEFLRENTTEFLNTDSGGDIKKRAEQIIETGVKMKDAYHIACAEKMGCDYLITTDKRMLRYTTDTIRIVNPINFLQERGEENE